MFRRIEIISHYTPDRGETRHFKFGLMSASYESVVDAWIDKLRGPKHGVPQNAKFYFTEKGWSEVGRKVIEACQREGQEYRVIRVKENEVNVVWRDKHTGYEVAVQPKKRRK